ncbi:hypothetical protein K1719_014302 [Acacia pycnantha]|nr:hypothetical protein K1719_014302 [Acacia pycnantha]
MASSIRVISTSNIHLASQNSDSTRKIELGPWDLQVLLLDLIQVGFLYHYPKANKDTVIQHLKSSLSFTLDFFPQLAGRLAVIEHDDGTSSVFIHCNNTGALFIHALAENLTISDILLPVFLPPIVRSFFPLIEAKNYQGTHKPLFTVQVTELVDGFFMGFTVNHALADGKSLFHFLTCWSEIARGGGLLSKPPTLERWFLNGIERPLRIRFPKEGDHEKEKLNSPLLPERVFHFSKAKIVELKAKATSTVGSNHKVSSLQVLMAHLWRAIIRNQGIDPKEEVNFKLVVDIRPRMNPPLGDNYLGNALDDGTVSMTAGELLRQEGLGKAALEMKKVVELYTEETIVSHLKSWLEDRRILTISEMFGEAVDMGGSPTFNVFGIDFGWGKPVMVRSGPGDKSHGTITVFAGPEEGDIYAEVNLPYEIMEAMAKDSEFVDAVTPAVGFLTAGAIKKLTTTVRSSL